LDLLINKKEKRSMWLHWGLRYEESVFWFDDFARVAQEYDNFNFDLTLSKPPEEWKLCRGYVTKCMVDHHKDFSKMGIYLCGGKNMIEDMTKLLINKGVSNKRIHREQFYE